MDALGTEMWARTFGGPENDIAHSVLQTLDGGFVLLGETESFGAGGKDIYLMRTDGNGDDQWGRLLGGPGNDVARSLLQTADGGFILVGYTDSFGSGAQDIYLIKTDGNGNELWSHTFGGPGNDVAYSLLQTLDGGYAFTGFTESSGAGGHDVYLIKTDATGNQLWSHTFGGPGNDVAYSLLQTLDGGYALAGFTESSGAGGQDFFLVKADGRGNELWSQTLGGPGNDVAYSVLQTLDGGFILAGETASFGTGEAYAYLIKADGRGNQQWGQTFGGPGDDRATQVLQTSDRGYILVGYTDSFGAGKLDAYLVKTEA